MYKQFENILELHNILNRPTGGGGDTINGLKTVNVVLEENIAKGDVLLCKQDLLQIEDEYVGTNGNASVFSAGYKHATYISNNKDYFYANFGNAYLWKYKKDINNKFLIDYDFNLNFQYNIVSILEIEKFNLICISSTNYIFIFKKNNLDSYDIVNVIANAGNLEKSPNEDYLFVAGNNVNNITMYEITENGTLTQRSSFGISGNCRGGVKVSPDGLKIAVGTTSTPFLYIANINYVNQTMTVLTTPTITGITSIIDLILTNNKLFVAMVGGSNALRQYDYVGDIFTLNSTIPSSPTTGLLSISMGPNEDFIIATGDNYTGLYKITTTLTFIKNLQTTDATNKPDFLSTLWINTTSFLAFSNATTAYLNNTIYTKYAGQDDFYNLQEGFTIFNSTTFCKYIGNYKFYLSNTANVVGCTKKDINGNYTINVIPSFSVVLSSTSIHGDKDKYLFVSLSASPYYKLYLVNTDDTQTELTLDVALSAQPKTVIFTNNYLFLNANSAAPIIYKINRTLNTFTKLASLTSPNTTNRIFSPDERFIITADNTPSNKIFIKDAGDTWTSANLTNLELKYGDLTIPKYSGTIVENEGFSPDGQKLIVNSKTGSIAVYNTTDNNPNNWTKIPVDLNYGVFIKGLSNFGVYWLSNTEFLLIGTYNNYYLEYNNTLNKFICKNINFVKYNKDFVVLNFTRDNNNNNYVSFNGGGVYKFIINKTIYGKLAKETDNIIFKQEDKLIGYALTAGNKGDTIQVKLLTHEQDF